ncbi:unnamed protein product [Prorocentrum cordatum]|uniref:Uncharacterized protein n=1 Tax=Prorocentrum cordatum TaxID=2364126 RepID=A0ABN9VM38_9DINO|nr:unnamed protein product [Polarella glacialis]
MAPADLAAMQAAWLLGRLRRWCMGIFWGARLLRTEGSCRGGARSGDSPRPSQGRPPGCPEVCPGGAARPSRRQARCWGRRERRWPPPRHPRGRAGGRRAPGGEGRRGPWPSLTAGTSVSIHNQTSTIIMSRVSAGARLGGRQSAWCSQRRGSLKPRVQHRVSRGG